MCIVSEKRLHSIHGYRCYTTDCALDMMKVIYWHSYDHLSRRVDSRLPPLDGLWNMDKTVSENKYTYLEELINDWGFIPWSREFAEKMSMDRDYDEFVQCYAGNNDMLHEYFDNGDQAALLFTFLDEFDVKTDHESTSQICEPKSR